jgi:hypothetical protein
MNPLLSKSGAFYLMNSRSDGRINSAIIPLFGDFDFLQIWQTSGAVLIGIRCRIKPFLRRLSIRLRCGNSALPRASLETFAWLAS